MRDQPHEPERAARKSWSAVPCESCPTSTISPVSGARTLKARLRFVDLDVVVAPVGDGRDGRPHALFEVARRGLERGPLGRLDGLQRALVDEQATLQLGRSFARGRQALGQPGHQLGIDRLASTRPCAWSSSERPRRAPAVSAPPAAPRHAGAGGSQPGCPWRRGRGRALGFAGSLVAGLASGDAELRSSTPEPRSSPSMWASDSVCACIEAAAPRPSRRRPPEGRQRRLELALLRRSCSCWPGRPRALRGGRLGQLHGQAVLAAPATRRGWPAAAERRPPAASAATTTTPRSPVSPSRNVASHPSATRTAASPSQRSGSRRRHLGLDLAAAPASAVDAHLRFELGDLVLQAAARDDRGAQLGQRDGRWAWRVCRRSASSTRARRRASGARSAPAAPSRRCASVLGALRLGQIGLLPAQLDVELLAPLVRLDPVGRDRPVSRARAASPAASSPSSMAISSRATLSRPGFFCPRCDSGATRRLELLLGLGRAAVGTADGALCRRSLQHRLVTADRVELAVTDAGGGAEEGLAGDAGDGGDLLLDEGVSRRCCVARRGSSSPPRRAGRRSACAGCPGWPSTSKSSVDLRGSRGAPGPGLADVLAVGIGLAEEDQLEGLLDGDLPASLGPRMMVRPGGRLDLEAGVRT